MAHGRWYLILVQVRNDDQGDARIQAIPPREKSLSGHTSGEAFLTTAHNTLPTARIPAIVLPQKSQPEVCSNGRRSETDGTCRQRVTLARLA
jgi:hypothetical protein